MRWLFALLYSLILLAIVPTEINADIRLPRSETVVFEAEDTTEPNRHYNWFRDRADRRRGALQGLIEPLFVRDLDSSEIRPWLALRATPNETATSYVIKLDRRARWSDGKRFTADDVVFSIDLAMNNPELDEPHVVALRKLIASVDRIDRYALRITLVEPVPDLIDSHFAGADGDSFAIVPKHIWKDVDPNTFENLLPVGTGPFRLICANDKVSVLQRNSRWWGARYGPYVLPEPTWLMWQEPVAIQQRLRMLTRGRLDGSRPIPQTIYAGLAAIAPALIQRPDLCWSHQGGPCAVADAARDDTAVEQVPEVARSEASGQSALIETGHSMPVIATYSKLFWTGWPKVAPGEAPLYWDQRGQNLIHAISRNAFKQQSLDRWLDPLRCLTY